MATVVVVVAWSMLVFCPFPTSRASTHWIVTEDGRIQAQADSVFNMRRPYDLMALLKQEERAVMLDGLKNELLSRKDEIDKNEDKDTGLEQKFYKSDPDCIAAGKPLPDYDLYISTVLPLENKGIRPEEHIDFKAPPTTAPVPPDCVSWVTLEYSIHAFEHLEGMKERTNLSGSPELGLKNAITHRDNVDDYGHLIQQALKKNTTSWVLYNMAAFYWRIKGDTYQVVECLRRALHFSPRLQKDVALISLANILHRARYSNEAAIVVHAALDISKELNVNHFTLGNIYAVLAEYNKSVICFENTLKIQPDFEAAAQRRHAVLCHAKLEGALEAQHRSLQRTLTELKDYQKKHEYWQIQNDRFVTEQAPDERKREQRLGYEEYKLMESTVLIGEYCHTVEKEGKEVLKCKWGRRQPLSPDLEGVIDSETKKEKETKEKLKNTTSIDYSQPLKPPLYTKKAKSYNDLPFKNKDWPPKNECDHYKFPSWNAFPTVYLPPENKGFVVKALLNEAQDLEEGAEHPLPWYPPVCATLVDIEEGKKAYDHIDAVKERTKVPLKLYDPLVKPILLGHVNGGDVTEEEVGQRILTALKKNIGPSWILYNLAGLYWRIIGNNYHGIECLRRALYFVPDEYKDVPLVNLANILYKWGRTDDAVRLMKEALAVNDFEPLTHHFLGNILAAKQNISGAIYHYEEALKADPNNQDFLNMLRTVKCYQKYHQNNQNPARKESTGQQKCGPPGQPNSKETESRIVCKAEHGKETCILETRTRNLPGQCQQSCDMKPECKCQCPAKRKKCCRLRKKIMVVRKTLPDINLNQYLKDTLIRKLEKAVADEANGAQMCIHNTMDPQANSPLNMMFDPELEMEKIGQLYKDIGICKSPECEDHNLMQPANSRPHIRLENINGLITQNLVFSDSPSEVKVSPEECIIFKDGKKSDGCAQEIFKPMADQLSVFHQKFEELDRATCDHANTASSSSTTNNNNNNNKIEKDKKKDSIKSNDSKVPKKNKEKPMLQPVYLQSDDPSDLEEVINAAIEQVEDVQLPDIPDSELPDTTKHIVARKALSIPTWDECQDHKKIDFKKFTSTWLSVTAKGIDPKHHVNFSKKIRGEWEEPVCEKDFGASAQSLDHIKGIAERNSLEYAAETGLKEVLQSLGDDDGEPGEVVGTRIAHALKKNGTSWVLGNLAALYWRVEGNAKHAVNCLRMALNTAPRDMRDISLLSMANVLYKSGRLNDAIVVINMALETSPRIVVIHFTLANIYAAKGDWPKAVMFYESTLGLQSSFEPARDRLKAIQCKKILEHPEEYKPKEEGKKKKKGKSKPKD